MKFDILDVIVIVGGVQGAFLMAVVYKQKVKNRSINGHLIWLLLSLTILFVVRILYIQEANLWPVKYYLIPDVVIFIFGPLVYLYFKALLEKEEKPNKSWILFMPAGFFLISAICILALNPSAFNTFLTEWSVTFLRLTSFSAIVWNSLLLYLSFRVVLRSVANNEEKPGVRFYLSFLSLLGLCLVLWTIYLTCRVFDIQIAYLTYDTIWILISVLVFLLGYYIVLFPHWLRTPDQLSWSKKMGSAEMDEKKAMLIQLIETEKVYLNPTLTLTEVAEKLKIAPNKLSWLINQIFEQNFNDFINEYRVRAFILKVQEKEHLQKTLIALAYEVGFNSKTTFNAAFKKSTNFTPSMYIRKMLKDTTSVYRKK